MRIFTHLLRDGIGRRRYLESMSPELRRNRPPPSVAISRVLTRENHKINSCPFFVSCILGLNFSGWASKLPLAIYPLATCTLYSPEEATLLSRSLEKEINPLFSRMGKKRNVSCAKEGKNEKRERGENGGGHCDLSCDCEVLRAPPEICKRAFAPESLGVGIS